MRNWGWYQLLITQKNKEKKMAELYHKKKRIRKHQSNYEMETGREKILAQTVKEVAGCVIEVHHKMLGVQNQKNVFQDREK